LFPVGFIYVTFTLNLAIIFQIANKNLIFFDIFFIPPQKKIRFRNITSLSKRTCFFLNNAPLVPLFSTVNVKVT